MSDIQPDDLFGAAAHAVDRRQLAVRRGQPVKDYGALFPAGRLWLTILIVSYLELAVVEASGVAAWQPITGYLWLQLYVGLIPTLWRWMRPATRHEVDAERRAAKAALNAPKAAAADDDDGPARAELSDEERQRIEATPDAWVDELTPERERKPDVPLTLFRLMLMPCLWIGAIVPLQAGLDLAVWGRQHWQIALPAAAALAVAGWLAYRKLRPLFSRPEAH